jgi:hypothetical protein
VADTLTTQSATPATVPASTVIATDDAGAAGHVQVVKLAVSTDGSATPLTANNTDGLLVNLGTNNDVTVTGSVTANAGTNLNTSTLALEAGGNLAAAAASLATLDNAISGNEMQVDIVSSALPTGAATLAEQQTQTTALQLIDDTVYTDGTGTPSKAIGVAGTDGTNPQIIKTDASGELQVDVLTMPTVAVTQSGTWDEVGINDSGNSITVDNGGTFATQVTSISAGDNNIGNVDLASAIPAGDNAIGRVKLTDGTDVADVLDLTNSNPLTVAIVDGSGDQIISFGGGTQYTEGDADATITGTAVMWEDGSNVLRPASAAKPLPVEIIAGGGTGGTSAADDADFTDGTTAGTPAMGVYESTPSTVTDGDLGVVGITEARRLKTSATIDAALPAGTNNIGDVDVLSSALPTGAATSANQTTANTALSAIQTAVEILDNTVSGNELQVDVLTMPTVTVNAHAVTNAGTFAVQVDGNALTSLQLADDVVATLGTATYTEASTKGTVIGAVRRDADTTLVDTTNEIAPLQVDANGRLKVEAFSGETLPVSLTSTTVTGTVAVTQSGTWDEIGINDSGNSITVDNGGTFATQSTLQAGTAAVGKLLPPDTDVTAHTNYAKKYYTNAGAVTDGIVWSPASGKRFHVVSMFVNTSAAATFTFEDDKAGGDEVILKMELAANSGFTINFGEQYPLASGEDAADLILTTSAGNCYVTVTGYEI